MRRRSRRSAQDFLKGAQLMTPIEGGMLEITGQGVDFLLKPRAEQVWGVSR